MSLNTHRQDGIIAQDNLNRLPITFIGNGGIGSPSMIALTKMGCKNITSYDFDTVESHNLPNQFYRIDDITKPKVEALKEIIKDFSDTDIDAKQEKFVDQEVQGLVISAVDKMDQRKIIWDAVKYNPGVEKYIEARMGGLFGIIYTVDPCDPDEITWYEKSLYSSDVVVPIPCTEKAIIFNVFGLASFIASQVKRYLNDERVPVKLILDYGSLTLLKIWDVS